MAAPKKPISVGFISAPGHPPVCAAIDWMNPSMAAASADIMMGIACAFMLSSVFFMKLSTVYPQSYPQFFVALLGFFLRFLGTYPHP